MPPRETGIETLGRSSSSRKRPSKCISNISWRSWVPVIAPKRLRSPCAAESSNSEKGNPPKRQVHTTKVARKKSQTLGFNLCSRANRLVDLQGFEPFPSDAARPLFWGSCQVSKFLPTL